MTGQYLIHLAFGPLLLALALLFKAFPPTKINYFYGYRMPRAMINQDTWDEANRYAATWLIYLSAFTIGLQLIAIFTLGLSTSIIVGAILMCLAAIAVMPITEKYLARTFDHQGNRKPIRS
jgi:uncharacterized membrane protein